MRVRGPDRAFVTPWLFGLNVGVFAVMIASGVSPVMPEAEQIRAWGANHGPSVAAGEMWRLFASQFIHVGIVHLLFNMIALRSLGIVERLYGNGAFLAIYLLSGFGGSIASVLWHPQGVSAGASGALMGLIGALLAFFLLHRRTMPRALFRRMIKNLVFILAINALFGLLVPSIDNGAHAGGLVTGFLAAIALDRDPQGSPRLGRRRLVRAVLLALVLGLLCLAIPWRV